MRERAIVRLAASMRACVVRGVRAALLLAIAQVVAAQAPSVTLGPRTATLAEEFTQIGTVRELSDGRVLIADTGDDRLVVADLRSGAVRSIGRRGAGPSEFESVGRLIALSADSTLLLDSGNGARWLILAGDSIVRTVTSADSSMRVARTSIHGAARDGSVLGTKFALAAPDAGGVQRADAVVLRIDRATGRVDTVTRTRGRGVGRRPAPGSTNVISFAIVLAVDEQALLFPDGWVAVVRQEPYRVEWHPPRGPPVVGPEIPWSSPKVDDAEKQAWMQRLRASGSRFPFTVEQLPFADVVPPFDENSLRALPDGRLLIKRMRWSGSRGNEYDIVDRSGRRTGTMVLPDGQRIVGFGDGVVFIAAADDDGIQRLERHRWP